jgi:leader peptidase (prepilin peptidase)/N-methyltransferase
MVIAFAALLGAVVGSFLNVCIRRIPLRESIVLPGSHCPQCRAPIRTLDNIPLLSWMLLRGSCRACGEPIGLRYPLVEALTAVAAVALYVRFGETPALAVAALFTAAMIVITFIDLDHLIIPDVISLPGIVIGFLLALLGLGPSWQDSLAGILVGGGFLWVVAEGYYRLTGREGMGGGDIKLLGMIGAFLGWQSVFLVLLLSSISGSVFGGALMLLRGADSKVAIPFGPFLALGGMIALFWGERIVDWYLAGIGL